jgi:hypothetical protein
MKEPLLTMDEVFIKHPDCYEHGPDVFPIISYGGDNNSWTRLDFDKSPCLDDFIFGFSKDFFGMPGS